MKKLNANKIALIILGLIIIPAIIGGVIDGLKSNEIEKDNESKQVASIDPTKTEQIEPTATPKPLTQSEQIEQRVRNLKLNGGIREFRSGFDNSYIIYLNNEYTYVKGYTEDLIKSDMAKIYRALYSTNEIPVNQATISSFLKVETTYGEEKEEVFYQTQLDLSEASKINWSKREDELINVIIPSVWNNQKNRLDLLY